MMQRKKRKKEGTREKWQPDGAIIVMIVNDMLFPVELSQYEPSAFCLFRFYKAIIHSSAAQHHCGV